MSRTRTLPPDTQEHFRADVRVSSILVRGLCEAIRRDGFSVEALLERAGFDAARLAGRGLWITLREYDALVREAVLFTSDPAFGLHWGERSPMMQLDLAPTLMANAPSIRDALQALPQFQWLFFDRPQCALAEDGQRCELSFELSATSDVGLRAMSELALAGLVRVFEYFGEEQTIRRLNFRYARPDYGDEYQRLFGSRLRFDQAKTSIEFVGTALARQHKWHSEELHRALGERTAELRQRVLGRLTYTEQVEGEIRAALPRVMPMASAALALGISERSLRRFLALEGAAYSELVDRVQHARATELLAIGEKSIKEVAQAIGYESEGGFHRAFRRWTGTSPGRVRSPRARHE